MIRPAIAAALLALLTMPVAAQPSCPQFFPHGTPPVLLNPKLDQRVTVLCNEGYAVAASGVTRGTLWSAEHLTAAGLASARDTRRVSAFHPEGRLPPEDQAQISDYRASGYDRGHMTPSGDMPTPTAQAESFSLANVVPQTAQLNRGVWEGIESTVRTLAGDGGWRDGAAYGPRRYSGRADGLGGCSGKGGGLGGRLTYRRIGGAENA